MGEELFHHHPVIAQQPVDLFHRVLAQRPLGLRQTLSDRMDR